MQFRAQYIYRIIHAQNIFREHERNDYSVCDLTKNFLNDIID